MTESIDGAEGRPGCLIGRLLGAVARLVVIYPLVCIGSEVGQSAQRALWPGPGTPYEGALAGGLVGLVIGGSLWLSARRTDGWRSRVADATLAAVAVVWLVALFVNVAGRAPMPDTVALWIACLAGAAGIAMVLRA